MDHKVKPPQYQVFINFRGDELRNNFISHLVEALQRSEINFFTDKQEQKCEDITNLFKRIEESTIALAVFSTRYTQSKWCLDELVKMKERADLGKLKVLPIFYNVTTYDVKILEGEFGIHFRSTEREFRSEQPKIDRWKEALTCISGKIGLTFNDKSLSESDFIRTIVNEVLTLLQSVPPLETAKSPVKQIQQRVETSPMKNNTKKAENIGFTGSNSLAPQAIASGHGRTTEQGPNKKVVDPTFGYGPRPTLDDLKLRFGGSGNSSSMNKNTKKPIKPSKYTVKDGWPSTAGPV